jgi:hypothetical protein
MLKVAKKKKKKNCKKKRKLAKINQKYLKTHPKTVLNSAKIAKKSFFSPQIPEIRAQSAQKRRFVAAVDGKKR